jgi:hypothetical protein
MVCRFWLLSSIKTVKYGKEDVSIFSLFTDWCYLLIYFSVFSGGRPPWGFLVSSILATFSSHFILKYFSVLAVMGELNKYWNPSWCKMPNYSVHPKRSRWFPEHFLVKRFNLFFFPSKRPRLTATEVGWQNWQCFSRLYLHHSGKEARWQVAELNKNGHLVK